MRVEFQVHAWINQWHQTFKALPPEKLEGCANVSEGALTKMLQFEQLADKEIAVKHERGKLRTVFSQLLDDPGPVHDVCMVNVRQQFINVLSAKRAVALT
jgi:hypothetical protein